MEKLNFKSVAVIYRVIAAIVCVFGTICFAATAPTLSAAILALIVGGAVTVLIDESIIQIKRTKK